jgi:hypothetical protein
MINGTDLPNQSNTLLQAPLMKKKGSTWTGYFSLLTVLHLLIILPLVYTILTYRGAYYPLPALRVHPLTNLLLPLTIIDLITVISYVKKWPPPLIVFFISLFAMNVIFFHRAGSALSKSAGGVEALAIIPFALCLLIIDSATILFYIIKLILLNKSPR